jgi:hypothetical protein
MIYPGLPSLIGSDPRTARAGTFFMWKGLTYGVVEGQNGTLWLDRNLGASRVAQASNDSLAYGYYYQWGRLTDGHQISTSGTTETLSTTDTPGHGDFILNDDTGTFRDWRNPQNDNLWQGVIGINNPSPPGWRVPTETELETERLTWATNNAAGAFNSLLKLPIAGGRSRSNGSLIDVAQRGVYWSSTVNGSNARRLLFSSVSASMANADRAIGFSVRPIKD